MTAGYLDVLQHVIDFGHTTSPRAQKTRELLGVTIDVADPYGAMPLAVHGRKAVAAIGVAEALQLIAGRSYPRLMQRITPNFKRFMDGEVLAGAYGPRVRVQLPHVVRKLSEDSDTRQAVLQIWDPIQDLMDDRRDVACTLALQFILRDGVLHLHSKMRSQDAWWGLAYDIFMFAELLGTVAYRVDAHVGRVVHNVTSLHLYEDRLDDAARAVEQGFTHETFAKSIGIGRGIPTTLPVHYVQRRAEALLEGRVPNNPDDHELWMLNRLEPHYG